MITIKKYNDKLINEWDSFVEKSNNGIVKNKNTGAIELYM